MSESIIRLWCEGFTKFYYHQRRSKLMLAFKILSEELIQELDTIDELIKSYKVNNALHITRDLSKYQSQIVEEAAYFYTACYINKQVDADSSFIRKLITLANVADDFSYEKFMVPKNPLEKETQRI